VAIMMIWRSGKILKENWGAILSVSPALQTSGFAVLLDFQAKVGPAAQLHPNVEYILSV